MADDGVGDDHVENPSSAAGGASVDQMESRVEDHGLASYHGPPADGNEGKIEHGGNVDVVELEEETECVGYYAPRCHH